MNKERLFKVLNADGTPCHGGNGHWSLPQDDQPGDWMPPIERDLVACANGYHGCREQDLVKWLGPAIYEMEVRGDRLNEDDKIVVREARLLRKIDAWNERTARLFACDCAEHVLPLFEQHYPDDGRPRQAIETARRFTNGEATDHELAAAWDAAWAAARAAAWAAARDAEREWQTARLMEYLEGKQ